jgi:hypothetical protein
MADCMLDLTPDKIIRKDGSITLYPKSISCKDLDFAKSLVNLWKIYKKSKKAREELNIPKGLPVYNAVNFLYWLEKELESL